MVYRIIKNTPERFWTLVKKSDNPNDCWEWQGGKDKDGYGRYNMKPTRYGAHRLSYMWTKGPIPPGMVVCHSCDNPGCVNPDHLWVGTQQDNVKDMDQKNRRVKPFTLKRP